MDAATAAWSFSLIPAVAIAVWGLSKLTAVVADRRADRELNKAVREFEIQQHVHPALRGAKQIHKYEVTVPRRLMLIMGFFKFETTETTRWFREPSDEDSTETEDSV